MKILKYGDGYPKIEICEHCKSELEYTQSDVTYFDSERLNTDKNLIIGYRSKFIICPVCEHQINIEQILLYTSEKPADQPKKKCWWTKIKDLLW
jgi:hypothetical protein